jgi:predicted nucleic acid-binding protein
MYLDSAYIAKFYLNERESERVRAAIRNADTLVSSLWAAGEVVWAFHRYYRAGELNCSQYQQLVDAFTKHTNDGVWTLAPVTDRLLRKMTLLARAMPATVFLRTADAVHLTTAQDLGESEIWSNDRHLLDAAQYFGLTGRSA